MIKIIYYQGKFQKNHIHQVKSVLRRIRESRKIKGYSHEYMSIMLDISPSSYNKLERSETTLSLERLLIIADILELSITEVFDIKTNDIFYQDLNKKIETLHQDHKEKTEKIVQLYEQLLKEKDDTIKVLNKLISLLKKIN